LLYALSAFEKICESLSMVLEHICRLARLPWHSLA
jgi:hypothetical protein